MTIISTDAIQWYEGMLLMPQHFQQSDLRLRELLRFHISQLAPYHWGIKTLSLNKEMFANGILYFDQLQAILPDGLVIDFVAGHDHRIELDLTPYKEKMDHGPMMIHLAVPKYNYGAANATGDMPRFLSREGEDVVDENTGQSPLKLAKLIPNARLLATEDVPSNFVSFPLFKIRKEVNSFILEDFIPPSLKVELTSSLGKSCMALCQKIREKITYLSSRVLSEDRVSDLLTHESEETIKALTTGLLPLEALLNSENAHPFQLFVQVTNLAAVVAALKPGQMPPNFKAYDHNDLQASFHQLVEFIKVMSERVQTAFDIVPFQSIVGGFELQIPERSSSAKSFIIGLRVPQSLSPHDVYEWIDSAIIATEEGLDNAVANRVRGAERHVVKHVPELKLHTPRGSILVDVKVDDHYVAHDQVLKLINKSANQSKIPAEAVLFVPKVS